MASSFLGSMAGSVIGTMIAQNFLGSHGLAGGDLGQAHNVDPVPGAGTEAGDFAGGFDDVGADFDGGSSRSPHARLV